MDRAKNNWPSVQQSVKLDMFEYKPEEIERILTESWKNYNSHKEQITEIITCVLPITGHYIHEIAYLPAGLSAVGIAGGGVSTFELPLLAESGQ